MKLLIVSANYPPRIGGPASSVPELAKRLAEKGHKVEIVTLRFQGFPAREKKKFTVHRVFHFSKKPEKTSTLDNIVSVISMALKVRSKCFSCINWKKNGIQKHSTYNKIHWRFIP